MTTPDLCKQCGFVIIIGGRPADVAAQEEGFCGTGCEEVYNAIKGLAMRDAFQEGH